MKNQSLVKGGRNEEGGRYQSNLTSAEASVYNIKILLSKLHLS